MQQQHTATSTDSEQVTEIEAPSNSLPSWSECNLRVGNSEWLKDNDREAECDSLTANPLHEFIYEYDDSDAYKSAWFLHRLENLIGFIRSEQHPSPDAALVEALERLVLAAQCRDNSNGDQIRLIETRAELSAAAKNAEEALALYRQQGDEH